MRREQLVGAGRQRQKLIETVSTGPYGHRDAGRSVAQFNDGAWHGGAGRVADDAEHLGFVD